MTDKSSDFPFENPYAFLEELCDRKAADIPDICLRGDVILSRYSGSDPRLTGMPVTNVPHLITRHSPTGFEWGYAGSGPADLALNILVCFVGLHQAMENGIYQRFKDDFLVSVSKEGGTIERKNILQWIETKGLTLLFPGEARETEKDLDNEEIRL